MGKVFSREELLLGNIPDPAEVVARKDRLREVLAGIIPRHLGAMACIYGSAARGTVGYRSDIDLAIAAPAGGTIERIVTQLHGATDSSGVLDADAPEPLLSTDHLYDANLLSIATDRPLEFCGADVPLLLQVLRGKQEHIAGDFPFTEDHLLAHRALARRQTISYFVHKLRRLHEMGMREFDGTTLHDRARILELPVAVMRRVVDYATDFAPGLDGSDKAEVLRQGYDTLERWGINPSRLLVLADIDKYYSESVAAIVNAAPEERAALVEEVDEHLFIAHVVATGFVSTTLERVIESAVSQIDR